MSANTSTGSVKNGHVLHRGCAVHSYLTFFFFFFELTRQSHAQVTCCPWSTPSGSKLRVEKVTRTSASLRPFFEGRGVSQLTGDDGGIQEFV